MMSQEPLGHLVQLHGKPHLELLEVINWPGVNYSHNSDNRNNIWNADVSNEYDYTSIGFEVGLPSYSTRKKIISVKANAYLDQWRPIYPIELREYAQYGASFQNTGYFSGVPVFDQNGARSQAYLPAAFEPYERQTEIPILLLFQFLR
jgi:hypothetical protein